MQFYQRDAGIEVNSRGSGMKLFGEDCGIECDGECGGVVVDDAAIGG
jgi:hypothetical protein